LVMLYSPPLVQEMPDEFWQSEQQGCADLNS